MEPKQLAALEALKHVRSGMIVGLGTGSTAKFFIEGLGQALQNGSLNNIRGIPTSIASEQLATKLGIPLTDFSEVDSCDVTVDGADEVAPDLTVIKGLGGALLREKIIAQNTKKLIIIADESKRVCTLGTKSPLPVEVIQFSLASTERFLRSQGCVPTLRLGSDGKPYITDNGNFIYDCRFKQIDDPQKTDQSLKSRAGVVETGLFVRIAKLALIATSSAVETMQR